MHFIHIAGLMVYVVHHFYHIYHKQFAYLKALHSPIYSYFKIFALNFKL